MRNLHRPSSHIGCNLVTDLFRFADQPSHSGSGVPKPNAPFLSTQDLPGGQILFCNTCMPERRCISAELVLKNWKALESKNKVCFDKSVQTHVPDKDLLGIRKLCTYFCPSCVRRDSGFRKKEVDNCALCKHNAVSFPATQLQEKIKGCNRLPKTKEIECSVNLEWTNWFLYFRVYHAPPSWYLPHRCPHNVVDTPQRIRTARCVCKRILTLNFVVFHVPPSGNWQYFPTKPTLQIQLWLPTFRQVPPFLQGFESQGMNLVAWPRTLLTIYRKK